MPNNIIDKIQLSGVTYDIGGSGGTVSSAITSGDTNAVAGGAVYDKFDEVEQVTAQALNVLNDKVSEDEEVTAAALNALNTNKQDKLSAGTGISISGNVISATGGGGGNPTVELTQAEYDALVSAGTVSADTYYIITDATPVDMSNYYTTAQTNTLLAGKQDTLSAGTGIDITSNVISVTGSTGGKAIEAGRGISVATGATADTISVSLPISAGTGMGSIVEGLATIASGSYSHAEGISTKASSTSAHAEGQSTEATGNTSHAEGYYTKAYGYYSHSEGSNTSGTSFATHAEGVNTKASGMYSHTEGRYTLAQNEAEHASGRYNVSSKANTTFGDSGNTLFSVGNGTADDARHNAFEIRQNGDIYFEYDGVNTKLQDKFDEDEEVTAAALVNLNERVSSIDITIGDINTILQSI